MKRATVALGVFFSLLASTLLASEAFILNIPVRGIANQETGMVRAVLTLNAALPGWPARAPSTR